MGGLEISDLFAGDTSVAAEMEILKSRSVLGTVVENLRLDIQAEPEHISVNTGVNKLAEYINEDFTYRSGTPYHVKGVANYHFLLKDYTILKVKLFHQVVL